jgi:sortase A
VSVVEAAPGGSVAEAAVGQVSSPLTGRRGSRLSDIREAYRAAANDTSSTRYLALTSLMLVTVLALGFCVDLTMISPLEYRVAQTRAFDRLRNELAHGVAPVSEVDRKGHLLPMGAPVALLTIPRLHVKVVVLEGTDPEVLTGGPGHLRDTVLPGQAGTSVVFGRAAAFGGPFRRIHDLRPGDAVIVTTGSGTATYSVVDRRTAGDALPAMAEGGARLTLVTATGPAFLPSGVLRVDADLRGTAIGASPIAVTSVPHSQVPLGTDTATLWVFAFILEALILVSVGAVVSWRRWGRAQTWIVFFPVTVLLCYYAADQLVRLLPNLT